MEVNNNKPIDDPLIKPPALHRYSQSQQSHHKHGIKVRGANDSLELYLHRILAAL
jgi:hypothetical protein